MAAPAKYRSALFATYAFNVEVSRAPWVSSESNINEIRLQWWLDALDEIAAGGSVRRHEVVTPLAQVIDAQSAAVLGDLVKARRWDIYGDPFGDSAEFKQYLEQTAGGLMWVAARATGVETGEDAIRQIGFASGLANWFKAVPQLIARGHSPLLDGSDDGLMSLAKEGLHGLKQGRNAAPRGARYATHSGWLANRTLRSVAANPAAVTGGTLHNSEFVRRTELLWRVVQGRP